jgi:hypothetical protein
MNKISLVRPSGTQNLIVWGAYGRTLRLDWRAKGLFGVSADKKVKIVLGYFIYSLSQKDEV